MLLASLLASVEHGLNRVLRLDSTALARLAHLNGKVIAVDCRSPALQLFILPSDEGLMLAAQWAAGAAWPQRAPAASIVHQGRGPHKTAHQPTAGVERGGDRAVG
ncbi:SCP2 sterol-binding domain-containing protein, partial [Pseudomonas canadensis]|uniref:SCP2 sterol-binding domain-containing protein n=1 Tax=Pseudomonas canadensis TaxID=915099 RepID=UPI003B9E07B3